MEYLMTYGWAILIIAIVIVALYLLGVINPANFAPRAVTGSCSVYRPNGPNTTYLISLISQCASLPPKFALYYNPSNPYATIGIPSLKSQLATQNSISFSAWIKPSIPQSVSCSSPSPGNPCAGWIFAEYANFGLAVCQVSQTTLELCYYYWSAPGYPIDQGYWVLDSNAILQQNTWYFVSDVINTGGTYTEGFPADQSNPGTQTLYLNATNTLTGGIVDTAAIAWIPDIAGGSYVCCGQSFEGAMTNVQLYNTSLSANSIHALYLEGIGGDPIDLQDLEGWWPLNGDTHDYSGNRFQGISGNVIYTSDWTSGYSNP